MSKKIIVYCLLFVSFSIFNLILAPVALGEDPLCAPPQACIPPNMGTDCNDNFCPVGKCCTPNVPPPGSANTNNTNTPTPPPATNGGEGATSVDLSTVSPFGPDISGLPGVQKIIGRAIYLILGVVGSIALLMFVYGGFLLLTSQGKTDLITKGKNVLIWAIIGIIVIFISYALVGYILTGIGATGGGTQAPGGANNNTSQLPTNSSCDPCQQSCPGQTCTPGCDPTTQTCF